MQRSTGDKMRLFRNPLFIILLIFILISGGGLIAYHIINGNYELRSKEMSSEDGRYTFSVPSGWEVSQGASQNAILAAESPSANMYAMLSLDVSDFDVGSTIEDYANSYISKIAESSDDPLVQVVSVPVQNVTLGGNTGYYFEIDTFSRGMPVHMWDFFFNGSGGYVHVDVCSSGEENAEHAQTAKDIISSVIVQGVTAEQVQ